MNSVLSYVAGFLVLLLFAALVGPSIVDWNSFRGEIEAQVSTAAGRPVTIGGDINFVILPAPRFSLQNVSVGPANGQVTGAPASDPLAEVGTLEGEIALAPLLRGEIEVTRIRVLDFMVRLTRQENGRLSWSFDEAGQAGLDPAAISLEAAHFENGTFWYRDASNNSEHVVSAINGELKAVSLLGPLRFDGDVTYEEGQYALSVNAGVFGGDRAFPVNLDVEEIDGLWRANFTGLATDTSAAARLDGAIQIKLGGTEGLSPEDTVDPVLSLQAGAVISREAASLRDVDMTVAGSVFKGQAEVTFDEAPSLVGELSGARLLVDRLIEELEQTGIPTASLHVPEELSGSLKVQVSDLGFGVLNATDVTANMAFDQGNIAFQNFEASFPGETRASVSGDLSFDQGAPRFDGSLDTTIGNLLAFGRWLDNRLTSSGLNDEERVSVSTESAPYEGPRRLHLQTDLALQSSLLQAYSLSAVFGDEGENMAPIVGGVSLARSTRPALGIELDGPLLDLNFLGSLSQSAQWDGFPDVSTFDASLVVSTSKFRLGSWELDNLDMAAALNDGRLSIAKFETDIEAGDDASAGHVSFSGALHDLGRFASGGIEGKVSSALVADWLRTQSPVSLPAVDEGNLDFVLRGEREGERHLLSLDVNGLVDGSTASVVFKQSQIVSASAPEKVDLFFSLQNDVAANLTRQLGFGGMDEPDEIDEPGDLAATETLISGEAALQGQISGAGEGPFDANIRLRAGETSLSASGSVHEPWEAPRFNGRFEASSGRLEDVAAIAGLQGSLIDLAIANGRQGAFIAGGALEWAKGQVAISELEAVAGTFRVSGAGTYTAANAAPRIDAVIALGQLNLDPIFVTDDGPWNANPLQWQALADLEGTFDVSASSVEVAGLSFVQVSANASLVESVLSFNPVTAQFAGGRLTMGGKFEGGAGVPGLGLTVALEDADIAAASKMLFGAPLATGVVTAGLQLEGQGRSLLGLVSTLTGRGTVTLGEGHFSGFDLAAFRVGIDELENMDAFERLAETTLRESVTPFQTVEGDLELEDGLLNFSPSRFAIAGAKEANTKLLVDLVRLEADVESGFVLDGEPALPPMKMVLAGPLHGLDRRTDTLAIQSAVAQTLLVREMEEAGVEELPEELQELIGQPITGDNLDAPLDDEAPLIEEETAVPTDLPLAPAATASGTPVPAVRPAP